MTIELQEYYEDMQLLKSKLNKEKIDCIVCLKRSGFILGAYLSNQLNKPLFVPSEISSIPMDFTNVLIVDDKICKGKAIQKVINKLIDKNTQTACLYIEGNIFTDYFCKNLKKLAKMWYEN